ncbi:MAG: hypothetical protein LBQ60_20605 [Bacteroidales bacterium]|jgi:hypothetical protein|nr:hypothetical protein [Bacteroidales bacterium]
MNAKRGFGIIGMWIVILAAFSAAIMLLWNALIPGIFGLTAINFWQALGLFILARILFGGFFGGRKMMAGGMFHHHKNPIREKWMKMTPEQREEFIRRRREFGFGRSFGKEDFFSREYCGTDAKEEPRKSNE